MTKSILVEQYTLTGSSNLLKSFQKRVEYKLLQSGNLVIELWQNTKIYTACFKKISTKWNNWDKNEAKKVEDRCHNGKSDDQISLDTRYYSTNN